MFLEKITSSTFSNAVLAWKNKGATQVPVVTIVDSISANGWALYRHFLAKTLLDKHIRHAYCLTLEQDEKFIQTMASAPLEACRQRNAESSCTLEVITAPVKTTKTELPSKSGAAVSFQYPSQDLSLTALSTTLAQTIDPSSPSFLFIDGISLLFQQHSVTSVIRWLEALRRSGLVAAIVLLAHADTLLTPSYAPAAATHAHTAPAPIAVLEALIDISSSLIQALPAPLQVPPPPTSAGAAMLGALQGEKDAGVRTDCVCVGGARVLHRRSTGKVSAALEATWITRYGYLRGSAYTASKASAVVSQNESDMAALKKLSKGLTFNVEMTDKQRAARDNVELPFAFTADDTPAPVVPAPTSSSTSVTATGTGSEQPLRVVSGLDMLADFHALGDAGEFEEMDMDDFDAEDPLEEEEI